MRVIIQNIIENMVFPVPKFNAMNRLFISQEMKMKIFLAKVMNVGR